MLTSTSRILTTTRHMFGALTVPPAQVKLDVYRTIAQAEDMMELNNGFQNILRIKTQSAQSGGTLFSDRFVNDFITSIRNVYPGYATVWPSAPSMQYV